MCLFEYFQTIVIPPVIMFLLITVYNNHYLQEELNGVNVKIEEIESKLTQRIRSLQEMHDGLEELRRDVEMIKTEITLQSRDMTGMVDYAFGGKVISIRNTETFTNEGLTLLGFKICGQSNLERRILERSVMPGNCWPFKGQKGSAVIQLIQPIVVTHATLEHAPVELLPKGSESAAPKEFSLWGLQGDGKPPHFFGQFSYNQTGTNVQTFNLPYKTECTFKHVEFNVHSNHGNENYTCVYRFRVHGHP